MSWRHWGDWGGAARRCDNVSGRGGGGGVDIEGNGGGGGAVQLHICIPLSFLSPVVLSYLSSYSTLPTAIGQKPRSRNFACGLGPSWSFTRCNSRHCDRNINCHVKDELFIDSFFLMKQPQRVICRPCIASYIIVYLVLF